MRHKGVDDALPPPKALLPQLPRPVPKRQYAGGWCLLVATGCARRWWRPKGIPSSKLVQRTPGLGLGSSRPHMSHRDIRSRRRHRRRSSRSMHSMVMEHPRMAALGGRSAPAAHLAAKVILPNLPHPRMVMRLRSACRMRGKACAIEALQSSSEVDEPSLDGIEAGSLRVSMNVLPGPLRCAAARRHVIRHPAAPCSKQQGSCARRCAAFGLRSRWFLKRP